MSITIVTVSANKDILLHAMDNAFRVFATIPAGAVIIEMPHSEGDEIVMRYSIDRKDAELFCTADINSG